ncbi:MAG: tetratricopeptide repeat protein, partial [Dechloromonas sp.]
MSVMSRLLSSLLLGCLLIVPTAATAQDADETDEDVAAASPSLAEQERLTQRAFPEGEGAQAQCVFLHERSLAYSRLARPEDALADLRRALALHQPGWTSTNGWCDRWRMQSQMSRLLRQVGDPRGRIAFVTAMGEEWRKLSPRRYFFTQTWLMEEYVNLGMLRPAEQALRRAGDLLPELRRLRSWSSEESNILNQWTLYQAYYQVLNGNFPEAERLRRESLRHALAYQEQVERRRGPGDPLRRIARGHVTSALRLLANTLAAQGKFAEAEIHARESLRQMKSYMAANSPEVVRIIYSLSRIKLEQGRVHDAERYARQALAALEAGQVRAASPLLADIRADLGFILQLQDRWAESQALFEARLDGLRSNPEQLGKSGAPRTDWALALLRNGRVDEAVDMLQRINGHYRKVAFADPQLVARARGYLAMALAEKGDDARALALFTEVVPALLQPAGGDAEDEGVGAGRQFRNTNILEAYLALLARLHARGQKVGDREAADEAFRIADVARGSAVQQAVLA